jgi:hypothetical protein
MLPSAIPIAATKEEAPPPPGTGSFEARISTNSSQLSSENIIVFTPAI